MYYDVIIIGAGPAGLKCAETLANSKYQILLLEKNEIIGPKICAGGLTQLNKDYLLPRDKTLSFDEQIINLNGREYKIKLKNPLLTIDRYELGQYQLRKIANCQNITIKTKTAVTKISTDYVVTDNNETYSFRYLIRADGADSLEGTHFNNIFLVGDAAGLASKNTGEGIAYALASGEDIAKYLLDNNYNFLNIKNILKYKKRQEFILATFNHLPFIQTFLFKIFITLLRRDFFQKFYGN